MTSPNPLLRVSDLTVSFKNKTVVREVSFEMHHGKTLAIVGESGSGKSVTSLAIMGLLGFVGGKLERGELLFSPNPNTSLSLTTLDEARYRKLRGNQLAMIFQEPMTSLNPVFTIGKQLTETLQLHRQFSRAQAHAEAARLLDLVRISDAAAQLTRYPHQLSGGQRQRVMIAMAAACQPKILIADEPTTALDVTVQAQILQIIRDMQAEMGTAVLFISHDMGVVAEMADEVVVMRHGDVIEKGAVEQILHTPQADYTRALMAAVPQIGAMKGKPLPEKFALLTNDTPLDNITAQPVDMTAEPLVQLDKICTFYPLRSGFLKRVTQQVYAAVDISFEIFPGETLALVGESGSGKSTVGRTLQQLVKPTSGSLRFRGQEILTANAAHRNRFKREIQYVFQDPFGSLNPRKSIRASLLEPMRLHGLAHHPEAQIAALMKAVDLPPEWADRYPHEFSGGQRQRICIARALACEPSLIIADEAVSALDVSVQAQVINLMMDLQRERGLSYLFISHDMAVVERVSHRVAVMYLGQIVEIGTRAQIFENPQHPYTQRLLAAVPSMHQRKTAASVLQAGEIPSPIRAVNDPPPSHQYIEVAQGHFVANTFA